MDSDPPPQIDREEGSVCGDGSRCLSQEEDKNKGDSAEEKTADDKMKTLLGVHLKIIEEDFKAQRKLKGALLKERLEQLRFETPSKREHGTDPIHVFPEELWLMILESIDIGDVDDLRNCARACPLFHEILNGTRAKWLFGKILPFIFNKLDKKDVMGCRLVCKKWCTDVDSFLESYHVVDQNSLSTGPEVPYTGLETTINDYKFYYAFGIPYTGLYHDQIRAKIKDHPRNPLIGGTVMLLLHSSEIIRDTWQMLNDFGDRIIHLKIMGSNDLDLDRETFYHFIRQILIKCPNLKRLQTLTIGIDGRSDDVLFYEPVFPDHSHLEYLGVTGSLPHMEIEEFQDLLIKKYSSQLKYLNVIRWYDDIYDELNWEKLIGLEVFDVKSIKHLQAPNLKMIHLFLTRNSVHFRSIIKSINRFEKLDQLKLEFTALFSGFSDNGVYNGTRNKELTCSKTVARLELIDVKRNGTSFDFLTYFPHLKRLVIQYRKEDTLVEELVDTDIGHDSDVTVEDENGVWYSKKTKEPEEVRKNYVDLEKYLWWGVEEALEPEVVEKEEDASKDCQSNAKSVYESNVWEVLPCLEFLEVCKPKPKFKQKDENDKEEEEEDDKTEDNESEDDNDISDDTDTEEDVTKLVYTRQGYEYFRNGTFRC